MFWSTHIQIARLIRTNLMLKNDIKLHLKGFIYGSIRPDIKPDFIYDNGYPIRVEHFVKHAFDYITSRLSTLMICCENQTYTSKEFATELGHIVHYFSDFFCYAHAPHFKNTMREHLLYELRFASYFNMHFNKIKHHHLFKNLPSHHSLSSLMTMFNVLQKEYLDMTPSYEIDAYYTLLFNTTLCHAVVSQCVVKDVLRTA